MYSCPALFIRWRHTSLDTKLVCSKIFSIFRPPNREDRPESEGPLFWRSILCGDEKIRWSSPLPHHNHSSYFTIMVSIMRGW